MRHYNILLATIFVLFLGCKKETDYIYDLEPVKVESAGSGKSQPKSTDQFVSIAWQDLFGTSIPQNEMAKLNTVNTAFGDKKVIEDIIIRNFLNDPAVQIPATPSVNGDTTAFIRQVYMKFYNREPGVFEAHYLLEQFRLNASLNPLGLYYAMMTSDEYRFY